jgi:hypothetical protein
MFRDNLFIYFQSEGNTKVQGSGYFAGKISTKMVNGYFGGTDYCRITIIITIIKTKQKRFEKFEIIKDEVLLMVSCPIFPSILIAKNLLTGSLKNRPIDNLETQKKSISMKNSQFFDFYSMQNRNKLLIKF